MQIMELKIFAGCFALFKSQSRKRSPKMQSHHSRMVVWLGLSPTFHIGIWELYRELVKSVAVFNTLVPTGPKTWLLGGGREQPFASYHSLRPMCEFCSQDFSLSSGGSRRGGKGEYSTNALVCYFQSLCLGEDSGGGGRSRTVM